jgi:hypothetical protein
LPVNFFRCNTYAQFGLANKFSFEKCDCRLFAIGI